ncbi:MAG: 2-oxoisovalerate dehydrogenase component beta subunit, partial [Actinomycetota bacterium]|nr:2-oxoisovalerate dehydrogenase component beta subunit [Actinomycetota bacterium]
MAKKSLIKSIHDTMWDLMAGDERVLIMGEDVGTRGGVFRATEGFVDKFGEERVIDAPLAESSIVGHGIGMALGGLLPILEIQFADFIHPAFNQIVQEAARLRYRSNGDFTCPIVIRAPYGAGVHGGLYHSQSVEAFFAHVPGLKIVMPSTPYDAKGLLRSALYDPDPVLYFEHK